MPKIHIYKEITRLMSLLNIFLNFLHSCIPGWLHQTTTEIEKTEKEA